MTPGVGDGVPPFIGLGSAAMAGAVFSCCFDSKLEGPIRFCLAPSVARPFTGSRIASRSRFGSAGAELQAAPLP